MFKKRSVEPIIWIVPCVIFLFLFMLFPVGYFLRLMFFEYNPLTGMAAPMYIGLKNFQRLFTSDPRFFVNIRNVLLFVSLTCAIQAGLGTGIAVLLTQNIAGQRFFQSVFILPMMIAPVVAATIWRMIFPYEGIINYLLTLLGLTPIKWLSGYPQGIFAFVIVDVWQWTPFFAAVLIAAIKSIPQSILEAAEVDGGSGWQMFTNITFPLITPSLIVVLLIRIVDAVRIFDIVYALTEGGPGYSTELPAVYIYKVALMFLNFGYAAVLSFVVLIITVGITAYLFLEIRKQTIRY